MAVHQILTFLSLIAMVAATLPAPQVYWNSVLPQTPMPKSVSDLLPAASMEKRVELTSAGKFQPMDYESGYIATAKDLPLLQKNNPKLSVFFLEDDLVSGNTMSLHLSGTSRNTVAKRAHFLPRRVADSIPFSSEKLQEIYRYFSVKPKSEEAEIMKATIQECESAPSEGVEKYCATSLESMIDFTTTRLGKNVQTISTEVPEGTEGVQKYRIVEKSGGVRSVTCHKEYYVYAVFYCHTAEMTRAFMVSLEGGDGAKVEAVAVCHPNRICHFIPDDEDHVTWVSSK